MSYSCQLRMHIVLGGGSRGPDSGRVVCHAESEGAARRKAIRGKAEGQGQESRRGELFPQREVQHRTTRSANKQVGVLDFHAVGKLEDVVIDDNV